jgi:ElaB/YqjD/DUF883 family membrane-anchored ribosome-binding protein
LGGLAIDHDLAIVLIAHPSLTGISTGSGSSGSTAWNNSVRSRLYLERIKDDDGREIDPDLRVLRVKKANYGPAGIELRLRWRNGAFILDGPTGGFDKLAADAKAERVFLDLLAAFTAQGRDVSSKTSSAYAPAVFAKHPNAEGISKQAFACTMERLLAAAQGAYDKAAGKARSALGSATDAVNESVDTISALDFSGLRDEVAKLTQTVSSLAQKQMSSAMGAAGDSLSQSTAIAQDKFAAVEGDVEDRIKKNPWGAVAIAALIGLLIGKMS